MAVSHDVLAGIHRLGASGDVLTGLVPCNMIIWDARDQALTAELVITDSTGTVVLVDKPQIASQHVGIFYPKRRINNPTAQTMTGGAMIVYEPEENQQYNW